MRALLASGSFASKRLRWTSRCGFHPKSQPNYSTNSLSFLHQNLSKPKFEVTMGPFSRTSSEDEAEVLRAKKELINIVDLAPEFKAHHPVISLNREYVKKVATEAPTFHYTWGGLMVVDSFRYLAPLEYQTEEHMELVYKAAGIMELLTSSTIINDDIFDSSDMRCGRPAHHISHPKSYHLDMMLVVNLACEAARTQIPDSHPCKHQLLETIHLFIRRFFIYYAYYANQWKRRLEKSAPDFKENPSGLPFHELNLSVYDDVSVLRFYIYQECCFNLGRYLACYASVPERSIVHPFRVAVEIMSALEDFGEFLSPEGDVRCTDMWTGAIHVVLCALLDPACFGKLSKSEQNEVLTTLRMHFGTGDLEDAKKVWKLYYKYNAHLTTKEYLENKAALLESIHLGDDLSGLPNVHFPIQVVSEASIRTVLNDDTRDQRLNETLAGMQRANTPATKVIKILVDKMDLAQADLIDKIN